VRSPVAERFWLVSAVVEKRAKVQPRDRLFGHLCTKPQTAVTTRAWFCWCFVVVLFRVCFVVGMAYGSVMDHLYGFVFNLVSFHGMGHGT
jgi:hypothetical protein